MLTQPDREMLKSMSPESGHRFRDKDVREKRAKVHGANLKDRDAL